MQHYVTSAGGRDRLQEAEGIRLYLKYLGSTIYGNVELMEGKNLQQLGYKYSIQNYKCGKKVKKVPVKME